MEDKEYWQVLYLLQTMGGGDTKHCGDYADEALKQYKKREKEGLFNEDNTGES